LIGRPHRLSTDGSDVGVERALLGAGALVPVLYYAALVGAPVTWPGYSGGNNSGPKHFSESTQASSRSGDGQDAGVLSANRGT